MKKFLVIALFLSSMVFAEFGAYVDINANGVYGSAGSYGAYWGVNPDLDFQGTIGGIDEDSSGINKGVSFYLLEGTYYFVTKDNISLGATGVYTALSGDGDTASNLSLGGSAKWKINKILSIKADAIAFSSNSGKFAGADNKGSAVLAGNGAVIYAIVDLF